MAEMLHREPNQVNWLGVRPAHLGTQISKSVEDVNNTTAIIHTVTAGKTLFLVSCRLMVTATGAGSILLRVRDDEDTFLYTIDRFYAPINGTWSSPTYFFPPLEIPAGYDIFVLSSALNCFGHSHIFGWEE